MHMMAHKLIGMLAALMLLGTSSLLSAQEKQTTYRNGQKYTEYTFPLKGDVEQIEIFGFYINPDDGKEYPRDTTLIRFNANGDVTYICPYVDSRYTDVYSPTELRFQYNNLGYNTLMREIVDTGFSDIVYDTHYTYNDDWQKIRGENYNEDGGIIYTEEYFYDSQGYLTHEKYIRGDEQVIYTYDADMNVIEIEEYYNGKLNSKTHRTYNQDGKPAQETVYKSNRSGELEINQKTTYFYTENGCLSSSESRSPIPEIFSKKAKDFRTETYDLQTYKCDSYGNVIEKTYYQTDSSVPEYRIEYRISYR